MPLPVATPICCYKRPLKGEEGLLPFGDLLWAFWCGIIEGKILKGKWQRGVDRKSALRTLT
jgi:hypothetical protein